MTPTDTIFCADLARAEDAPLRGTATAATTWFLLEVRTPWAARATDTGNNDLPPAAQAWLEGLLAAAPDPRLLFIRQERPYPEHLRFFVVQPAADPPRQYEYHLHSYDELAALDPAALLAPDAAATARHLREEPLFLVCSNGKRDKCCARYGVAAFKALHAAEPDATWQTTHIGGHRYAPNMLFMPHAVNYGGLAPEEAVAAAAAYRAGRLYDLDHYRGRTGHAPAVQAAASYLRAALELLDLDALHLQETQALDGDLWRVTFGGADGATHAVTLRARPSAGPRLVSCSPPAEKHVPDYELVQISAP